MCRQSQEQLQVHAERVLIRGLTFMQTGYPDTAAATFAEGLKVHPDNPVLLASMASAQEALGDPGSALFYMNQALENDPNNGELLSQALALSLSTGDRGRTSALVDQMLELSPTDADLILRQILLLSSEGASQLSIKVATQAIQLFPEDVHLLRVSARTFEAMGDLEHALSTVRRISLLSGSLDDRLWLGKLLVQDGAFDEAADLYIGMLETDPYDEDALATLSSIQSVLPERDLAEEAGVAVELWTVSDQVVPTDTAPSDSLNMLRTLWEADPEDEQNAIQLTEFLLRSDEADEAARFAKGHVEENLRHIDMWILAIKASRAAGNPAESVAVAEDALLLYPGFQPLEMEWILSLAADNQPAAALQAGRELLDHMDPDDERRAELERLLSELSPPQ